LWIAAAAPENVPAEWMVETAGTGVEGIAQLRANAFDVTLIDAPIPEWSVEELLEELLRVRMDATVVVRHATASVTDAARYVHLGAHDVADGETDIAAMIESMAEYSRGRRAVDSTDEPWRKLLVGSSRAMQRTADVIRLVGGRRCTVLITGETGTGKEMVARALHMTGPRAQFPLVAVNCNALPESLLEAELFGHVKGAFTGSIQQRLGRFEQAHRGTLFLDEIGDLPVDLQTKLLRVLQEREFQRIGSSETIRADVRVVAATHVDLAERIRAGIFREDLYYRLNVAPISTPPLRDRLEDIPALAHHFSAKICQQEDIPERRFARETLARLASYSWPGNVRQLENAVEMAVAMSGGREVLYPCLRPRRAGPPSTRLLSRCPTLVSIMSRRWAVSSGKLSSRRCASPAETRRPRQRCWG